MASAEANSEPDPKWIGLFFYRRLAGACRCAHAIVFLRARVAALTRGDQRGIGALKFSGTRSESVGAEPYFAAILAEARAES